VCQAERETGQDCSFYHNAASLRYHHIRCCDCGHALALAEDVHIAVVRVSGSKVAVGNRAWSHVARDLPYAFTCGDVDSVKHQSSHNRLAWRVLSVVRIQDSVGDAGSAGEPWIVVPNGVS